MYKNINNSYGTLFYRFSKCIKFVNCSNSLENCNVPRVSDGILNYYSILKVLSFGFTYGATANQRGASDSVANLSALSNPADAQNVSCLGLCGRDICPKSYASYGPGTFNPQLSVSIYIVNSKLNQLFNTNAKYVWLF